MTSEVHELEQTAQLMFRLSQHGVDSVLFGSLGVAIYLGRFKEFGDTDLLVEPVWVSDKWNELQRTMALLGYTLVDEKEHEFQSSDGEVVAFAGLDVFERDGIAFEREIDIVDAAIGENTIKTFSPELLKRAYEYSVNDGYRTEERGKKDQFVIDLLEEYINREGENK